MSASHKATLERANAAIATGDIEGFLVHCTDDIQWTTVGESTIDGKEALRQWMATAYAEAPTFSLHRLVAEDDVVVALGDIVANHDDGTSTRQAYADVWRFRDGRMAELQAFVI